MGSCISMVEYWKRVGNRWKHVFKKEQPVVSQAKELDTIMGSQFKEKPCPYCGGRLKPTAHPPLTIRWHCEQCPHSEFLGPLDMRLFGKAMMNK